jgi:hypothetical protein
MLPDRSNHNRAACAAPLPQSRRFFLAEGREPSGPNTALKLPHDATRSQQSQPGGLRRSATTTAPLFFSGRARALRSQHGTQTATRCYQIAAIATGRLAPLRYHNRAPFFSGRARALRSQHGTQTATRCYQIAAITTERLAPLRYHNRAALF